MTDTTTQNHATDGSGSARTSAIADLLGNLLDDAADIVEEPNRYSSLHGLPTGFRDLDRVTGGLTPGSLTVIASRPQVGRTTLLTDICRNTAIKNNIPTAVYSSRRPASSSSCGSWLPKPALLANTSSAEP